MIPHFELFLSNRLEVLYQELKSSLFGPCTHPLMRRIVVVYGPAMKSWLTLKMAQDPELNVAFGVDFLYLHQAFEYLTNFCTDQPLSHVPTACELALSIEKECMAAIEEFSSFSIADQKEWSPLIQYLKINPHRLSSTPSLSRKVQRRLISLSQYLGRLFLDYGRFAPRMVAEWEASSAGGWQGDLWRKIFMGKMGWTYPSRALKQIKSPSSFISVHFFSISFITASEFSFLNTLSKHLPIHYYLLSPCAVFWSDIRSDRESAYLQALWQKRIGPFSPRVLQLEELLGDRNPLLANFGRMGREMALQIEESNCITHAKYLLSSQVKELGEEHLLHEDLSLCEDETPLTLLHAIQADLLLMRNPQGLPPVSVDESKSIQLHAAPSRRREVEILYHNLLGLIAHDPEVAPGDIIVMAPQINEYASYIESIFGSDASQLDYQLLDLGMQAQSEIVQGFFQLLEIAESRWEASSLLQLFGHPSFQRRHQLNQGDVLVIQEWIEQTGIRWGNDWLHRNALLKKRYCDQGMVDETPVGTWDYGISRLLYGLTTVVDRQADPVETPPCGAVEFSQSDLLGKWIRLLHSIRDDLSPLEDETRMTMDDWINFFHCLLENYFKFDVDNSSSEEEYDQLKRTFETLRRAAFAFKETLYPFATIKTHLASLLQQRGMSYREDRIQSVRFCSLIPLRSIPAKVIALVGMQEGAFPRTDAYSSLNLMIGSPLADYSPLAADYDRYLFLEALHSAQDYLIFSYQGYSQKESKEQHPSLIIEEFFSYLDKYYTVGEKKVSERCIVKHPCDSFDYRYFTNESTLSNYSECDYRAACMNSQEEKKSPYRFLSDFSRIEYPVQEILPNHSVIDIRYLSAVVRNPIKFHLQRVLDIKIETEEDRMFKGKEEITLTPFDKYTMKQYALRDPIDRVLYRAERDGRLPFGLFKILAERKLNEEVEDIYTRLNKHGIDRSHFFQLEFSLGCAQPTLLEEGHWLLPPIVLTYEDGARFSIVGKVPNATSKGLVALGKGTAAEVWKAWPHYLLYCHAAKIVPLEWSQKLIFSHASTSKEGLPFEHPDRPLKQLVRYYALCLKNFSPLLPDWVDSIGKGDVEEVGENLKQVFEEKFGSFPDPHLRWILNKEALPGVEFLLQEWKEEAIRIHNF